MGSLWRPSDAPRRAKPTFRVRADDGGLTIDEATALFADRRLRYGQAIEWLEPRELRRLELDRYLYRKGRLTDG